MTDLDVDGRKWTMRAWTRLNWFGMEVERPTYLELCIHSPKRCGYFT